MKRGRATGFSLTEMLLVLAIISIVAAIAIPSLISALDRGRQKRTMGDIRALSSAIEAYSLDHDYYPQGSDISVATAAIAPDYIRAAITNDGWNNAFIYEASQASYTLGSAGKDGGTSLVLNGSGGATHDFNDDIIYVAGQFRQWPEGLQE